MGLLSPSPPPPPPPEEWEEFLEDLEDFIISFTLVGFLDEREPPWGNLNLNK